MKKISFSIACYNEELNIPFTYKALKKVALKNKRYQFEYVFSDNNSNDRTKDLIRQLAKKDKNVVGVFLSRNFGHESNGQAAMDFASGDAIIPIECDLQDPPELISQFIKKWEEGYDIVLGIREKLDDGFFMNLLRKLFYKFYKAISDIEVPVNSGAFSLMDRRVVTTISSLPEKYRFFRGLRAWVGFKSAYIKYERKKRLYGKSSYKFFDYIKHSERGVFGFTYLFLDIIVYLGFILVGLSFLSILVYLSLALFYGNPIKGSITILVSIVFFGGIQMLAISIIGKYIQVIVEETKNRPLYIVDEVINKRN